MDVERSVRSPHLPDDVLRQLLDEFSLLQLLVAAGVCRAWRAVALAHPTYSRTIDLQLSSFHQHKPNAVAKKLTLFAQRLIFGQPLGSIASLDVSIGLPRPREPQSLGTNWSIPFQMIRVSMERLVFLSLYVDDCFLPLVRQALASPAPRLEEFRLAIDTASRASCCFMIPATIFSGVAQRLEKLGLDGHLVHLPRLDPLGPQSMYSALRPIPAFSFVREVRLNLGRLWGFHQIVWFEHLFAHCPRIERLVLRCSPDPCLSPAQPWSALARAEVLGLRHLSFLGDVVPGMIDDAGNMVWGQDTNAVVRAFAHARMETLELNSLAITSECLIFILSHFGNNPLHLKASTRSGEYLNLTLHSLVRPCTRTFSNSLCYTDHVDADMFSYYLSPLAAQITHLTVHRNWEIWDLVARIFPGAGFRQATFPCVEKISVVLGYADGDARDYDERFSAHSHEGHCCFHALKRINLPALKCVELVGPAEDTLYARDLAELVGAGLGRTARRDLLLVLNGVQIEGGLAPIWGYFDRIELLLGKTL